MTDAERVLDSTAETEASQTWQRLSPLSVVYFIFHFLTQLAQNAVQGLAPIAAVILTSDNKLLILSLVIAAIVGLVISGAILSYIFFRFQLTSDKFLIRKGVIKRDRLTLHFDRVQNIRIKQPFYFKPFNLVTITLDSAGSAATEVNLAGLRADYADNIRNHVLAYQQARKSPANTDVKEEVSSDTNPLLHHRTKGELVRYGLSNNSIWIFLGLTAPLWGEIEEYGPALAKLLGPSVIALVSWFQEQGGFIMLGFILALLFLFILFLMLFSVVGAILVYNNFKFFRDGDRFRTKSGLINSYEGSLHKNKIQVVSLHQSWIAWLFSRWHMTLKQIGGVKNMNGQQDRKFLVPSVTREFYERFINELYPAVDWSKLNEQGIDSRFVWRKTLILALIPAILAAGGFWFLIAEKALWFLAYPAVFLPFAWLRFKRHRFGLINDHMIVKKGFIGTNIRAFSIHKIQAVTISQSRWQRRHKLATLSIRLTTGWLKVPYIQLTTAKAIQAQALYQIEARNLPWM